MYLKLLCGYSHPNELKKLEKEINEIYEEGYGVINMSSAALENSHEICVLMKKT